MKKPPRDRNQGLLTLPLIAHSHLFLGRVEGMGSLCLFFYVLDRGGWTLGQALSLNDLLHRSATGITLSTILLMQTGNFINRRFATRS